MSVALPTPTPPDLRRLNLVYHYIRLQLPQISLERSRFDTEIARTFAIYYPKADKPITWNEYLGGFYALDWDVCIGCLNGSEPAWETLFAARTGRSDMLLIDALRSRAARLYPRNEEKQETAVNEFWSHLITSDAEGVSPVLARYDGQRPLAPWLIRVFQNRHLSQLRVHTPTVSMPDDDLAVPVPNASAEETRWHELFSEAAGEWLETLQDDDRILLGLRWRYKMSQRDAATIVGVHEGTLTRRTDKLRDKALESIGRKLIDAGWTGDDLEGLILTELGGVLTDDPRLSAASIGRLLSAAGKSIPASAN
ncbi:MAG: sigma-70 family RNA polymerase sigma factor [Gemmataceae bacterium]